MRTFDINTTISKIQKSIIEYVNFANAEGVIIGLSGGIDSAVTAFLCSNALGKEKVIGLGLPCKSDPNDIQDAELISNLIGIEFIKIDLTSIFEKFIDEMKLKTETNKLALANTKSRLRMVTLYFINQSRGRFLVAGTGNRTELSIGYFTKYGDGGVDFEPIGDLFKSEVKKIAKILEIPEKIINKAPSAGLWEGQTDEDEIGISYDELDEIIYRIDNNLNLNDFNKEKIIKIKEMMNNAQHKLKMPPIFKIF